MPEHSIWIPFENETDKKECLEKYKSIKESTFPIEFSGQSVRVRSADNTTWTSYERTKSVRVRSADNTTWTSYERTTGLKLHLTGDDVCISTGTLAYIFDSWNPVPVSS